jgi:hypothetical protein
MVHIDFFKKQAQRRTLLKYDYSQVKVKVAIDLFDCTVYTVWCLALNSHEEFTVKQMLIQEDERKIA